MVRSKLGLKVLGLCAVVLGTMAFASAAQAEPNAYWLVNGAKFTTLKPLVEAETDVPGTLLTELGGKFIHITCTGIETLGHLSEPLGQVLGKIIFHGCKFFELVTPGGSTKEVKACEPVVGENKGLVETNQITGLIKLHTEVLKDKDGKVIAEHVRAYVEAVPVTHPGPPVVTLPFATLNLGEECAFGENITVGGKFWLRDPESQSNLKVHLVEELKSLTALTVNGGAKVATIDGSAFAKLGGAHENLTFSANPG